MALVAPRASAAVVSKYMTMLFGSQILTGLFLLTAKSQNMRQATFGSGLAVK